MKVQNLVCLVMLIFGVCYFFIFYFLFLISYFLFLISYFLFLISYFLFLISYFLFLIKTNQHNLNTKIITIIIVFRRRHHCRRCGHIFCRSCSSKRSRVPEVSLFFLSFFFLFSFIFSLFLIAIFYFILVENLSKGKGV